MRKINAALFKKWFVENKSTVAKIAYKSNISASMVEKWLRDDYSHEVHPNTRQKMCKLTGFNEDDLFPDDGGKKRRWA
jgi:transcriptional regulator with XRE-family HTH domain